jgi:universal stress protein E
MNAIRNILVIVDPTADQHPAISKGALLAQKFGSRLELFVCDTKASREARLATHMKTRAGEPFVANVKAILEGLAAPLRERGLDVTTETECADPLHAGLVDRTKRTSAELVVKDTHHHSLTKRTFLTNTDWHLIRTCPVPLLLTKANAWSTVPRILAAVDPGHANDKPAVLDNRILDCAFSLSRCLGGDLHLLHAYLPATIVAAATAASPSLSLSVSAEDPAAEERQMREQLQALAAEYRVNAENIHLEIGGPSEVLPRLAGSLHADVMTMGVISRNNLRRAFIGSTAEDVLEYLPCDALIVKSPDFAAMLPF